MRFTTLRIVPIYDESMKIIKGMIWMGASQRNNQKESVEVHEKPLKGTWISVGVVGAVILATYLLLYGLYMTRV